jgi:hypothetical protein
MRYSKLTRQRLGRSWTSLTSRFLNSMREEPPIRKTLRLTCTRYGQLRDRFRVPTMICIRNGIRLLFLTTYPSHRSDREIVVQQQYSDYICPIRRVTVSYVTNRHCPKMIFRKTCPDPAELLISAAARQIEATTFGQSGAFDKEVCGEIIHAM